MKGLNISHRQIHGSIGSDDLIRLVEDMRQVSQHLLSWLGDQLRNVDEARRRDHGLEREIFAG